MAKSKIVQKVQEESMPDTLRSPPPLCSCGFAKGCDAESIGHFIRMGEKGNFANAGECGIFSDYSGPNLGETPEQYEAWIKSQRR